MGATGLLVCICQETCPSFKNLDVFEMMNAVRREKLVDFAVMHPQLYADDGNTFLKVLLEGGKVDKLFVVACTAGMQIKLYRSLFEDIGFDPVGFIPVDVRNMSTGDAVVLIKKLIELDKNR